MTTPSRPAVQIGDSIHSLTAVDGGFEVGSRVEAPFAAIVKFKNGETRVERMCDRKSRDEFAAYMARDRDAVEYVHTEDFAADTSDGLMTQAVVGAAEAAHNILAQPMTIVSPRGDVGVDRLSQFGGSWADVVAIHGYGDHEDRNLTPIVAQAMLSAAVMNLVMDEHLCLGGDLLVMLGHDYGFTRCVLHENPETASEICNLAVSALRIAVRGGDIPAGVSTENERIAHALLERRRGGR